MKILILTTDYPDMKRSVFVFVRQFAEGMARMGHDIQVIAPFSITQNRRLCQQIKKESCGSGSLTVYRPYYVSFSTWSISKYRPQGWRIEAAFKRGFRMLKEQPQIVYGHFWPNAFFGYDYAKANGLPIFVSTGESVIHFSNDTDDKKAFCQYVSGVVCVSSKNKEESIKKNLTTAEKCIVLPNAVDTSLFHPMDRKKCRSSLGIPQNIFIVIFVGWFNERKGVHRVAHAIRMIEGDPVYSMFIGGKEPIDCSNILIKDRVPHNELPVYLNAADVFVLPTRYEGCCNAIIEAMACGLPIISSDLPFNYDILNRRNAVLVNPMDVSQIVTAITLLRDDMEKRRELSYCAMESVKELTIDKRIRQVCHFIETKQ